MARGEIGPARCDVLFGNLADVLSSIGIAPLSLATFDGGFEVWKQYRRALGKGIYVDAADGPEAIAFEVGKFVALLFFSRGNKLSTVVGRLSAIKYFHRLRPCAPWSKG